MTNEEKILEKLNELTEEIKTVKNAVRPYIEFKKEVGPIAKELFAESVSKLDGIDRHFTLEEIGDMLGQVLVSSSNITSGLKTFDQMMELKKDLLPLGQPMLEEAIGALDNATKGFNKSDFQELIKQAALNVGNMAEAIKLVSALVEFKNDVSVISKDALDDLIQKMEVLKQKGFFDSMNELVKIMENVGQSLLKKDLGKAKPIKGVFGLMSALKREDVQNGLGVMVEILSSLSSLKTKPDS